jgi:hypothetical protein
MSSIIPAATFESVPCRVNPIARVAAEDSNDARRLDADHLQDDQDDHQQDGVIGEA